MFLSSLFIITKTWKEQRCPSISKGQTMVLHKIEQYCQKISK